MNKIAELLDNLTWEQLSNKDGTFNQNCVTFEEFVNVWLKDSDYENETEWAQRRLYNMYLKRIHLMYVMIRKERE